MFVSAVTRQVTVSFLGAVMVASIWVALTRATGLTYHFMPLAIGAASPVIATVLGGPASPRMAWGLGAWGLLVTGLSWAAMSVGGFAPTATFVADQPGGVEGEVVIFGVLGAAVGARYASRRT